MAIYYRMRSVPRSTQANQRWGQLADWIARQDRPIPIYHKLCTRVWLWAFRQSLT